jgi:type I restriction enzyme S subunit
LKWVIRELAASEHAHGLVMSHINRGPFLAHPVALPPLAEQSRIVAKVDELMALCDQLEVQQQARRHLQSTLRRVTLQALAKTQTTRDTQTAWTRLIDNFTQLFSAPEDVGVLRTLILELAVKGYLTEQNESDVPADQQVAKIRNLSTQSAESGRRRKAVLYRPVDENELDYQTPNGWALARLGELVRVLNGRAYSKPELLKKGTPVLRVGNLFTSKDWYYSDLELEPDKYCDKGDLLYAWSASFGPFIWSGPKVIFHYHIWKLDLFSEEDLSKMFLHLVLQERTAAIKTSGHGISMAHMTKEKMEQLPIAVPPLAEQRRIVARVSELMRLCDNIEKQLRDANMLAERLAVASVATLTGIAIEQEEAPVKAPKTELFAPLHLGTSPGVKQNAPLASILARQQGGLNAKDLWRRYGGEIDAFYAQLKLEVANGWIREPELALMNEIHEDDAVSA